MIKIKLVAIQVYGLAWSPDGTRLASAALDNTVRVWDASGLTGNTATDPAVTLEATWNVNAQGPPVRLAWSPDETQLAVSYAGGAIQVWTIDAGTSLTDTLQPSQTLEAHSGAVWGLAWSDGSRLATSSEDQTIRIWDGQTLRPLATLSGHADTVSGGVAWNPDGTALASGFKRPDRAGVAVDAWRR